MSNEQIIDPTKPIAEQIEAFLAQDQAETNVAHAKACLNEALGYKRRMDKVRRKLSACETQLNAWIDAMKAEIDAGGDGEIAYDAQRREISDKFYNAVNI